MTKKKETHPIPDAEVPVDPRPPAVVCELKSYDVFEWCPTPDGSGPPEQVHVIYDVGGIGKMVVRFKSAGELDRFIAVLTRHRLGVWNQEGQQ